MKIRSSTYLLRLWAETLAFRLSHLLILSTKIQLRFTRPSNSWLSYDDLISLNKQFKCVEKSSLTQDITQQKKWADRVSQIADAFQAQKILEVGCGYGLAAYHLLDSRREVHANDILDIRHEQVKNSSVIFSIGDTCQRLPYPSNIFDLVFSINSYEHFNNPLAALEEMIRILRPGGILFLVFSDIYYSPWGLHASRRLGMPYPQLLFSSSTIQQFVDQNLTRLANTYSDISDRTKISPYLNGYSLEQYRRIFRNKKTILKILAYVEAVSLDGLHMIHRYPNIIKGKIPSIDDLFIRGIKLLAIKKG